MKEDGLTGLWEKVDLLEREDESDGTENVPLLSRNICGQELVEESRCC